MTTNNISGRRDGFHAGSYVTVARVNDPSIQDTVAKVNPKSIVLTNLGRIEPVEGEHRYTFPNGRHGEVVEVWPTGDSRAHRLEAERMIRGVFADENIRQTRNRNTAPDVNTLADYVARLSEAHDMLAAIAEDDAERAAAGE